VIGVLAGDLVGDPESLGLDVLLPAFFLALLVGGELRTGRTAVMVAVLGGTIGLLLTPLTPAGVPVIAASGAALLGLGGRRGGPGEDDRYASEPQIEGDPLG
jgi:predicted branched-subunit amino acid permease